VETGPCPKLAETLAALGHRRHCSAEFGFGLVFLATGHDGDGRILQLPPPTAGRAPDWLCAGAAIRRRIPRSPCARHSLFTRGRAFIGGGILPLRNQPPAPDRARIFANSSRSFLGHDAVLVARPNKLECAD